MSSAESTNGISRRAVLAGAAAIGGTIAVASALGTGVTTAQAAGSARVFAHFGLRPSPWR